MPVSHRKPTKAEKQQVVALAREGHKPVEIASQLNVDARSVTGVISSAQKRGELPPSSPRQPFLETTPMPETPILQSVPPPAAPPAAAQAAPYTPPPAPPPSVHPGYAQPAQVPQDAFVGWRPSAGQVGAFTNTSQLIRYTVKREVPPDGILGQHAAPFDEVALGNLYGQGNYRLYRYLPGKPNPEELEIQIGASYGPSRWPKAGTGSGTAAASQRPDRPGYQRPWERPWEREEEGERGGYRPGQYASQPPREEYRERERERERDRALFDFARHSSANGDSAAAEAIRQFGDLNKLTVQQMDALRKAGPDTYLTQLMKEQSDRWEKQRVEERERAEKERLEERDREDRRRKDEQDKWDRHQQEERDRHERELARIKVEADARTKEIEAAATARHKQEAEDRKYREEREASDRKYHLELEDKKLALIREESRLAQQRLESELTRTREEMKYVQTKSEAAIKESQEKTLAAIKESQEKAAAEIKATREMTEKELQANREAVKEELERQEDFLDREHKLKEKSLDKEHDLNNQILEIKKEAISKEGGDQLFNMLQTVVKEFSKGLEKIVDLKKLEASAQLSPEAQAAAITRGAIDGNVLGDPRRQQVPTQHPQHEDIPAPVPGQGAAAAQNPAGNGNGHGAAADEAERRAQEVRQAEEKMDAIVQGMLKKPFFQSVLQEWALHVQSGSDATTFANMYLEWMRDPNDDEGRKACAAFATYMKPRNWAMMLKALAPHLPTDILEVFRLADADDFYESFRTMVVEQIKDYWQQFLAARQAQPATQQRAQTPAPSAGGGSAAQPDTEATPVPTRASLGQA